MSMTWVQALNSGDEIRSAAANAVGASWQAQRCDGNLWALLVYALADEAPVGDVPETAARMRYRLMDRDVLETWLCMRLQALGHQVEAPEAPSSWLRGTARDRDALQRWWAVQKKSSHEQSDDPVVNLWRDVSLITAISDEMSDGTIVDNAATSQLREACGPMRWLLDALLVLERGGWQAGSRVTLSGIPDYISPTGRLASDVGVFADRAEIDAPWWTVDDYARTVADGPPMAYWVCYRSRRTGRGMRTHRAGPVNAEHITLDLGPLSPSTPSAASAASTRCQPPVAPIEAGGPTLGASSSTAELDTFRKAAFARLWTLRDTEIQLAGDSAPRRVAQRMINHELPCPPVPLSRDLASFECFGSWDPIWAPGWDPEQQLVTGERREWLSQWLSLVGKAATPRQREVLDGLLPEPTLDKARDLLLSEGFVEVADIDDGSDVGSRDILAVHEALGLLGAINSSATYGVQWIAAWGNAEALDRHLLDVACPHGQLASDTTHRITNVWTGRVYTGLYVAGGVGGSIRTQLAALRALTTPVTPWRHHPDIHLGADSTPSTQVHALLRDHLPAHVHERLGPLLLPDTTRP